MFHPKRIAFIIHGLTGIRSADMLSKDSICPGLKITDFNADFTEFEHRIHKPTTKKYYTGNGITKSITYKIDKKTIPKPFNEEIRVYVEQNIHLLKDGYLFQFNKDTYRRYLNIIRDKAKQQIELPKHKRTMSDILINLMLSKKGFSYHYKQNKLPKKSTNYRFSLGALRKFDTTLKHYLQHNQDMVITQLYRGHTFKDTTMGHYVLDPRLIGITQHHIKNKIQPHELLSGICQTRLNQW